jgi:hypothetical protein
MIAPKSGFVSEAVDGSNWLRICIACLVLPLFVAANAIGCSGSSSSNPGISCAADGVCQPQCAADPDCASPGGTGGSPTSAGTTAVVLHLRDQHDQLPPAKSFLLLALQDQAGLQVLDPETADQSVVVHGAWFVLYSSTSDSSIRAMAAVPRDVGEAGIRLVYTPAASGGAVGPTCYYNGAINWTGLAGDSLVVNGIVAAQGTAGARFSTMGTIPQTLIVSEFSAGLGSHLWTRALTTAEQTCSSSTNSPTVITVDPGVNPSSFTEHPLATASLTWTEPFPGEQVLIRCTSKLGVGAAETCRLDASATSYAIATDATDSLISLVGGTGRSGYARLASGAPAALNLRLVNPTAITVSYEPGRVTALITPNDPVQIYTLTASDNRWTIVATARFVATGEPIRTPNESELRGGAAGGPVETSSSWTLDQSWSTETSPDVGGAKVCGQYMLGLGQQCATTHQNVTIVMP